MTVLASDNFNRANENPLSGGGVWTTGSGNTPMQVVSNACTPTDISTTDDGSYYSGRSWPDDQYSKAKLSVVSTTGGGAGVALLVRQASAANTKYRLVVDHAATNNVQIEKWVAGSFSALAGFPVTQAWTDGDTWELRAVGSSISAYRNGVQVGPTATDTAITSGFPGIGLSTFVTSASADDWEGGDLAVLAGFGGTRRAYGGRSRIRSINSPSGPFDRRGFLKQRVWDYTLIAAAAAIVGIADVGSLVITGFEPTSNIQSVSPAAGDLQITGFAPSSSIGSTGLPGTGQLTITGFAARSAIATVPGLGQIVITGQAPAGSIGATGLAGLGQLVITGQAPAGVLGTNGQPGLGQIVIGGLAARSAISTVPGTGALLISGFAPSSSIGATGLPGTGQLTINGFAPTSNLSGLPGVGALLITGLQPSQYFPVVGIVGLPGTGQIIIQGWAPKGSGLFFPVDASSSIYSDIAEGSSIFSQVSKSSISTSDQSASRPAFSDIAESNPPFTDA